MFQTKVVEKIKTHILCSVNSPAPHPENRAVYEIMWKSCVTYTTVVCTVKNSWCWSTL